MRSDHQGHSDYLTTGARWIRRLALFATWTAIATSIAAPPTAVATSDRGRGDRDISPRLDHALTRFMPCTAFTTVYSTSGSMVATARDLVRWADRLYGGDVLSARALRGMLDFDQAAGLPCAIPCPLPYGLGAFRYDIGGRLSYGHDGSSGAIVAYFPT